MVDPMVIVPAYLGIGDNDQAIAWLEKAFAQRSNGLTGLKVTPCMTRCGDPRFQNLLRRLGLAHSHRSHAELGSMGDARVLRILVG